MGQQISAYNNFQLSAGYGIDFGAGDPPQPELDINYAFGNGTASLDLWNNDGGEFDSDGGSLSMLTGLAVTFANCQDDTAYASKLTGVQAGNTICYTGGGVIAAVTVLKYVSSNNVDYALLDVKIWQGQS